MFLTVNTELLTMLMTSLARDADALGSIKVEVEVKVEVDSANLFCLNKECLKLLCGLGIGHRRRQTIPVWNSSGEKGNLQGMSGVCGIEHYVMTW